MNCISFTSIDPLLLLLPPQVVFSYGVHTVKPYKKDILLITYLYVEASLIGGKGNSPMGNG